MAIDTSLSAIAWQVKRLLGDMLGVDPGSIRDDTPLFDTDHTSDGPALDSLDAIKLGLALADAFGFDLDTDLDYSELSSVRAIATYIRELLTEEVSS